MFEFSKIADVVLHPSVLVLLTTTLGCCCCLVRRRSVVGRRMMMTGAMGLLLASLPIGDWPLAMLENRFPEPVSLPAHVDGIIVLGGAIDLGISAEHGVPALKGGGDRMTTFVALARYFPNAKLVFTGGGEASGTDLREADVARDLFGALGLDLDRIVFEGASLNTHENAVFTQRIVHPKAGETWLLVTSAADIPRAIGCFEKIGWPVTPWPVAYRVIDGRHWTIPNPVGGLANLDWAMHEWLGLVYYRLRGWTDIWFPGPASAVTST